MPEQIVFDTEKRAAKRKRSTFTIQYSRAGDEEPSRMSSTIDVSSKSVLFEDTRLLSIGDELSMDLTIPSLCKPVHVEGHINRIIEKEKGKVFYHCMLFDRILDKDREYLEKYVQLIDMESLLEMAMALGASDIHLVASKPPIFRVDKELVASELPNLVSDDLENMIYSIMTEQQKDQFNKRLELDFTYLVSDGLKFRINVHREKRNLEAALRVIPSTIKSPSELGLPDLFTELAVMQSGLLLISGPVNSGKTTTMAALVDLINSTRNCMIVGIEDPIEYIHENKFSVVKQREVGVDTMSYTYALKHVLHQDADVVFVGELQDSESVSMAMTAAQNGKLVIAVIQATDTVNALLKLTEYFPHELREHMNSHLASCLECVTAQLLFPRLDGKGKTPAVESIMCLPNIKRIIREGSLDKLPDHITAGVAAGVVTMEDSIKKLVDSGLINPEDAAAFKKSIGATVKSTVMPV